MYIAQFIIYTEVYMQETILICFLVCGVYDRGKNSKKSMMECCCYVWCCVRVSRSDPSMWLDGGRGRRCAKASWRHPATTTNHGRTFFLVYGLRHPPVTMIMADYRSGLDRAGTGTYYYGVYRYILIHMYDMYDLYDRTYYIYIYVRAIQKSKIQ